MKKILVTGGAGYIGSVLVRMLLDRGYGVRVFDRLVYGKEPIADLLDRPGFELVEGEIRKLDEHPGLFDGIDGVLHLASLSNDPSCDLKPQATHRINYLGAMDLAARSKAAGVDRFVFASSCSVYGFGHNEALTEESHLHPMSLYAESMVRCENKLREMADDGFCPVMLRQSTVFGLSPRMRFDLAINIMTLHAIRNKKVFVLGGGRQWRPFVHVADTSQAFILALEASREKVHSEVFNVGSNEQNYQILDLAGLIKKNLPETEVEIAPEDADKRNYNVNFDKISRVLGFKAKYTAVDGIREVAKALEEGVLVDLDSPKYYNLKLLKAIENTPAIEGGDPALYDFLPFGLPLIGKEEEDEVLDTLRSGWMTTGPKTRRFEDKFREYVGAKYAVAVNSCTAALHLALCALDIGPGDEVITSPVTFAATANVIIHCGATPVFVDVEPGTLNIDPAKIKDKLTARTKAIMPVHMAGRPCDLDAIRGMVAERGIPVVEDAAHALGTEYRGKSVGSISEFSCFSFYPIKNITSIEGGMVTTDDREMADRIRVMSLHGMTKDAWNRYSSTGSQHWEIVYPGYKYNMTDVQASVALHQMDRLAGFLDKRRRYASMYDDALGGVEQVELMPATADGVTSNHLYIIKLQLDALKIDRDRFMEALRQENIGTGIHFRSLHLQPYYRDAFGFKPDDFPVAHEMSERILSLPLYPKMVEENIFTVADAVKKLAKYYAA